jgi:hypothetical protein
VKNDTQSPSGAFNGVYSLTILQGVANKPVLTRALDYDMPSDINNTGAIPVINGTVNATTQWVLTSLVNTVGTDPLTYAQFSANPANNLTAAAALTSGNLVQAAGNNRTTSDSGVVAANVVTASATLTSTQIMTGAGTKTAQTPSSAATVDSSGNLNAATLIASGIVDGKAPVTLTTGASCTLGTASGCNATKYLSGYTFNQDATAAAAITYTLPTAAVGLQYCVKNSYNGSAADTGTLTIQTSASGQFIIVNGTPSATGGFVISGGAAGDAACVVGISTTQWEFYAQVGTWALH